MGYVDAEWCALDEFICRRILRLRNCRALPDSHWEDATARECVHKIYAAELSAVPSVCAVCECRAQRGLHPFVPSSPRTIATCSHRNMNIKLLATDTEDLVDGTSFSIRVLLCHRTVSRGGIEFTPMTNTTLAKRARYVICVTAANIQHLLDRDDIREKYM